MGESDLHLAVALDGAGWHPAAWREPDARPARAVHRRLLGRPGHRGRARPARLRHHRGRASACSPPTRRAGRPHRPGPRPARRRADRRPRRAADPAHRARADRGRHAHRAVPRLQGDRHARLRQHRPRRRAGAGLGTGPTRPRTSGAGRSRRPARRRPTPAAAGRPVRRGRRLRRGAAPALGQLGGRRGDPRRRHRPLRRPRQAALHRLRGRALLRQGPVDHPAAAAGPAGRRRARAPRPSPYRLVGAVRRRRLRHAARRRAGAAAIVGEIRAEQDAAGRGGETVHVFGDLVVFLDDVRRRGRGPQASGSTGCAGARVRQRRPRLRRDPGRARRPAAGVAGGRADRASGCGPATLPHDLHRDHPRPGARAAAARRLPHRLRGRHPARPARPAPPRQPLRRRRRAE